MITVAGEVLLWGLNINHCGRYCPRRRTSGSDEPLCVRVQWRILSKWRTSLVKGRGHGTHLQQLALTYHTWN